jgi:Tol biopolymer transport system component
MPQGVGSRLGPYEIEAALGAGGMGEVYRARDTRLGRSVALKVLAARLSAVPGQRERFVREARAISSVEHPNICPLYDVGTSGDVDFIVMQFVEGETLAERLARGRLALPEALAIARQIAAGLEAAHAKGVVHRDLKPANVQLTREGEVRLLDFGLARVLDERAPAPLDTLSPTQAAPSAAGSVVGTAPYMSPEQARGEAVDARADVWAFACVVYEMLTARRAFAGDNLPDVMAAIVAGEPDWARLPAETPAHVRRLLRLCLRKERAERLRDMGDIRLQLQAAGLGESGPSHAPRTVRGRVRTLLPWGLAAAALAAAAVAVLHSQRTSEHLRPAMRFSAVTNVAGVEAQPSLSPDGRSVAYVSNPGGQWDVFVSLVSGGSPVRVTNDPNLELHPRWSPDGSRLAFGRVNEKGLVDVWVAQALGGTERLVVKNARQPAWSPDGRQLSYASNGTLWLSDASGANARALTRPEPTLAHHQPAFSPDGSSVAFLRRRDGPRAELAIVDVATAAVRELTHEDALVTSPVWSPDGRSIYACSSRGGTLNVWKFDAGSGAAERITAGVGDDVEIDLSKDGTRLVFATYRANPNLRELRLAGPEAGATRWLTTDSVRGESYPRYSPDGRRIAYFSTRYGGEPERLWVMNADGSNASPLVEDERPNLMPRWTHDSQALVYLSRRQGTELQLRGELRLIPLTGGAASGLGIEPGMAWWGDVGPDGRLLVRVSATAAELIDPSTRESASLPDVRGEPVWSRAGRRFAYVVRPEEGEELAGLWTGTLEGERRRVRAGWFTWCAWTGAGDLLAITGRPDLRGELWRVSRDGRAERVLADVPLTQRPQVEYIALSRFDVHPDGSRIVLEAYESVEADISLIENVP